MTFCRTLPLGGRPAHVIRNLSRPGSCTDLKHRLRHRNPLKGVDPKVISVNRLCHHNPLRDVELKLNEKNN